MNGFGDLLDRFSSMKALVVGDLMLDEYIFGRATRISPEAPVMVVRQTGAKAVPGGAANVALNLAALGAQVRVAGVVGTDAAGHALEAELTDRGAAPSDLVRDPSRVTTRKTRVLADHAHQVLRIDDEDDSPLAPEIEGELLERVEAALPGCDVVLLSDYLKGTLTEQVVHETINLCHCRQVTVVANPKPRSAALYNRATLVSLNRYEATDLLGLMRPLAIEDAPDAAHELRYRLEAESVLITLGEAGMVAARDGSCLQVPAPRVEVYDTAGAGDTVVATVALGHAAVGFDRHVFELAAQTGAKVVQHVGVACPTREDLLSLR
jgi:D-beta-D-heptose 7-phosphate kinase/D-beta-D-heptose 1-phosphate adenosyltransferase